MKLLLYILMAALYVYARLEPSVLAAGSLYAIGFYLLWRWHKRTDNPILIVVLLGSFLNAAVILGNGGLMPSYSLDKSAQRIWQPVTEDTVLRFLADGWLVPAASIGDLFLGLSMILFIIYLVRKIILEHLRTN